QAVFQSPRSRFAPAELLAHAEIHAEIDAWSGGGDRHHRATGAAAASARLGIRVPISRPGSGPARCAEPRLTLPGKIWEFWLEFAARSVYSKSFIPKGWMQSEQCPVFSGETTYSDSLAGSWAGTPKPAGVLFSTNEIAFPAFCP